MIYESLMDIVDDFDTFFFDAFGVFNFGGPISKSAIDVMKQLMDAGKSVSIMSNAPRKSSSSIKFYRDFQGLIQGVHYQNFFSSGQVFVDMAVSESFPVKGKKYYVAWELPSEIAYNSDIALLGGSDYIKVKHIADADFVFCEFPTDNGVLTTDLEVMRPMIKKVADSGLIVLNPNPDMRFIHNDEFVVAQGLVCKEMEKLGTRVFTVGKPFPEIYTDAMEKCGNPDPVRTLMIGDTIATDILGGTRAGIKTCLTLEKGITANELVSSGKELTYENIHTTASEIGAHIDYIIKKVPAGDL